MRLRPVGFRALALCALSLVISGCGDYVILHPTVTPDVPIQSLPPIGFSHRYGNTPVSAADGFDFEHTLYAQQVFWEVAIRADPQLAGFVDRSNRTAVAQARASTTTLLIVLATERIAVIQGMLAFADALASD